MVWQYSRNFCDDDAILQEGIVPLSGVEASHFAAFYRTIRCAWRGRAREPSDAGTIVATADPDVLHSQVRHEVTPLPPTYCSPHRRV